MLRLLKYTKFGITDSIVQGTNRFKHNSTTVLFLESLKDLTTENCLASEKLVRYKVCEQTKFPTKSKPQLHDVNLKPISATDIECLERETQDADRVIAEKRKILQSLRSDIDLLQQGEIPSVEEQLQHKTKEIEINLANFLELNKQLTSEYNALNQSTQKLLSQSKGENDNGCYRSYCFHDGLFHSMHRMSTNFNIVCRYLNRVNPGLDESYELELDLIRRSLSHLRTKLEMIKCKNFANIQCVEKLNAFKMQLEEGVLKLNTVDTTRSTKSMSQMSSELSSAWSRIADLQSALTSASLVPAYERLCNKHLIRLNSPKNLLQALKDSMSCVLSFNLLIFFLVQWERDSCEDLAQLLCHNHALFDQLYSTLEKQELKLKGRVKVSPDSTNTIETCAQQYATQLITPHLLNTEEPECLEAAENALQRNVTQEKMRIQQEYSMENVFRKLAPLRQRMEQKSALIFSGPSQVPSVPLAAHNQLLRTRILQLNKIKAEYARLLRDGIDGESDSGIESLDCHNRIE